jgi:hypothetical protein
MSGARTGRRVARALPAVAGTLLLAACSARTGTAPVIPPPIEAPPAGVVPTVTESPPLPPADTTVRSAPDGDGDRRFLIVAVGDSTVSMLAPRYRWMRPGLYGIAVDPGRRDVLVARLRIMARVADTAVAVVTGQTTPMSTDYVAIFRRPSTPVLRQRSFWGGLAAGFGAGIAAVLTVLALR